MSKETINLNKESNQIKQSEEFQEFKDSFKHEMVVEKQRAFMKDYLDKLDKNETVDKEIALFLIENNKAEEVVIDYPNKFDGLELDKELALFIIKNNQVLTVHSHRDKFHGLDEEVDKKITRFMQKKNQTYKTWKNNEYKFHGTEEELDSMDKETELNIIEKEIEEIKDDQEEQVEIVREKKEKPFDSPRKKNIYTPSKELQETLDYIKTVGFFKDQDEEKKEVKALKTLPFPDLLKTVDNKWKQKFPHAKKLVDLFSKTRTEIITEDGKKIKKRPHLLIPGGFIRDFLMNKKAHDMDFATNLPLEEIKTLLEDNFPKATIKETGKDYGVIRIIFPNPEGKPNEEEIEEYEFACFRIDGESNDGRRPDKVETVKHAGIDAERRDLTVNGLFYNPFTGDIIDYVGGFKDIKNKDLKFIGDPKERIEEDRLRMLRYVRFLLKTGLKQDDHSVAIIKEDAEFLKKLSKERIGKELNNALQYDNGAKLLDLLQEFRLLEYALPAVSNLNKKGISHIHAPETNLLEFIKLVCKNLSKKDDEEPKQEIIWATYFQDISKGRERYNIRDNQSKEDLIKTDLLSSQMAKQILDKFALEKELKKPTIWLIENRSLAMNLSNLSESDSRKLLTGMGKQVDLIHFNQETTECLMNFANANLLATKELLDQKGQKEIDQIIQNNKERVRDIQKFLEKNKAELIVIQKQINGPLVEKLLDEKYGKGKYDKKMLGIIIKETIRQIVEGKIVSPEEAKEILKKQVEDAEKIDLIK